MTTHSLDASHKAVLDSLLLSIRGVEAADMTGLPAYFVGKKMFACICNGGVGIRLPASEAANLQFSRADAAPFEPKGRPSTREWVQINRGNSADYAQDMPLFEASIAFVRAARS
jgi:hypothetical protein